MSPWPAFMMLAAASIQAAYSGEARENVIAADRAFASVSAESGQLAAFEEFLASDAIVFRPGPVNGRQWLGDHTPATGRLEWQPVAAAASCDGRLAVTSGPWTYVDMDGRQATSGYYLSLWRRAENGEWQVVLDHATDSAPNDAGVSSTVAASLSQAWPGPGDRKCGKGDPAELERAERKLNAEVRSHGWAGALQSRNVGAVVAYRDGAAPLIGIPPPDAVTTTSTLVRSRFVGADPGSDMGYSFGEVLDGSGNEASPAAMYVRVWQRTPRGWRVMLDMLTRVTER